MKRYISASYENKFWALHSRDYEVGTKLEDIVESAGLYEKFFPETGTPTAEEDDYKKVLVEYEESSNPVAEAINTLQSLQRFVSAEEIAEYLVRHMPADLALQLLDEISTEYN